MSHSIRFQLSVLPLLLIAATVTAAGTEEEQPFRINEWFVLGPLQSTVPAFDDEAAQDALPDLLDAVSLPGIRHLPEAGQKLDSLNGPIAWSIARAGENGLVQLEPPDWAGDRQAAVFWLATSIRTTRFVTAKAEVESSHRWKLILDGDPVEGDDLELDLDPGDHVLAMATVFDPDAEGAWTISVSLTVDEPLSVSADLQSERELAILDVLDAATVAAFDLSPSGDRVALTFSRVEPGTDEQETWVELRSTTDGSLLRSWRGAPALAEVRFAPTGNRLSYVTKDSEKKTATLWLADLDRGNISEVVGGVEKWGGYLWSPTGKAVVFSTTTEPDEDERGIKRLQGLLDRMAGHRDLAELHLVDVSSGVQRRLTGGRVSAAAAAYSPDGSKILVTREVEDLSRRPYSRQELWELELATGDARKLRDFWWLGGVEYSPDGSRLLVQAGPSEFGDVGVTVAGSGPVNDFDGQLFIWDPETGAVDAISRDFDPAVTGASWSSFDGSIIVLAIDGHRRPLFRYDPESRTYTVISTEIESVGSFDAALDGSTIIAEGTSVWQPQRVVVAGAPDQPERLLVEPAAERFADVRRGEVREWNVTLTDGREIAGRIYYPTTFDPIRHVPGDRLLLRRHLARDRSFGGRYPKEWWAANGYVVYVLQPVGRHRLRAGASTVHVNDWGKITSRRSSRARRRSSRPIRSWTRRASGCIGASYGGFMTMMLLTRDRPLCRRGLSRRDLLAGVVLGRGLLGLQLQRGGQRRRVPLEPPRHLRRAEPAVPRRPVTACRSC